jgi:hypothetical protein
VPSPNTITLRKKISTDKFWDDINIQTVARCNTIFTFSLSWDGMKRETILKDVSAYPIFSSYGPRA